MTLPKKIEDSILEWGDAEPGEDAGAMWDAMESAILAWGEGVREGALRDAAELLDRRALPGSALILALASRPEPATDDSVPQKDPRVHEVLEWAAMTAVHDPEAITTEVERYLVSLGYLPQRTAPEPAPESEGCPYGWCGGGYVCTGCKIDQEIAKMPPLPPLRDDGGPMTETTLCVVCGGEIEIPLVRPRSDTWNHTDQGKCVAVLRAQRETMNSEVAAWAKRAQHAESDLAALRAAVEALAGHLRSGRADNAVSDNDAARAWLREARALIPGGDAKETK